MTHCPIEAFVRPGPAGGASHVVCGQWLNRPARALPRLWPAVQPPVPRTCFTVSNWGQRRRHADPNPRLLRAPTGSDRALGTRVIVARSGLLLVEEKDVVMTTDYILLFISSWKTCYLSKELQHTSDSL